MNKKNYLLFFILAALPLLGAGCLSFNKVVDDGGVFVSPDRGDKWVRKIDVLTVGEPKNIGRLDVASLVSDPSDSNTLYALTSGGVYVSYDASNSWQQLRALGGGPLNDLAISPGDKCDIYAARQNKIYKSSDCGRSFGQPIYDDPRADNKINSLAVDSFNPKTVYAGTSRGDLLKTLDGGRSWQTINRFQNEVAKVLIDQDNDTRIVYVATKREGIFITADGGATWENSSDKLRSYAGALQFSQMVYHKNVLILANKYGLFKYEIGSQWGDWQPLDLLTAPGSVKIYSLAVNPQNGQEIYYGADSTFYRTADGGKTWTTKKLPTSRAASALLVHPETTEIIYLGATAIKEDRGVF